jgi:hypothetical protein
LWLLTSRLLHLPFSDRLARFRGSRASLRGRRYGWLSRPFTARKLLVTLNAMIVTGQKYAHQVTI